MPTSPLRVPELEHDIHSELGKHLFIPRSHVFDESLPLIPLPFSKQLYLRITVPITDLQPDPAQLKAFQLLLSLFDDRVEELGHTGRRKGGRADSGYAEAFEGRLDAAVELD